MSSVPEDVYLEILLRVPVKSTFVCKCVCKCWFQIISNPRFVKMHLNISTQKRNYNLMFRSYDGRTKCWALNSISYDSLWSVNGSEDEIVGMSDYPFTEPIKFFLTLRFLGSCNGVVCISFGNVIEKYICFCNPATKEYKTILSSKHNYIINVSAFGYDCKDDDYKLIILDENRTEFFMHRLGSETWESNISVPYTFLDEAQTGILVNGVFHWLGRARKKNSSNIIVGFDFSKEKFNELQLSKEFLEKEHLSMTIGVLEGYLCAVVTVSEVYSEVWVMQDYATQESWTRRYTFDCRKILLAEHDALKLMPCFRNGQILLRIGYEFYIYEPKDPRGRQPKSVSRLGLLDSIAYVESLVSLNSGTYAIDGRNKEVKIEGLIGSSSDLWEP